jgi:hypothetical protein
LAFGSGRNLLFTHFKRSFPGNGRHGQGSRSSLWRHEEVLRLPKHLFGIAQPVAGMPAKAGKAISDLGDACDE